MIALMQSTDCLGMRNDVHSRLKLGLLPKTARLFSCFLSTGRPSSRSEGAEFDSIAQDPEAFALAQITLPYSNSLILLGDTVHLPLFTPPSTHLGCGICDRSSESGFHPVPFRG